MEVCKIKVREGYVYKLPNGRTFYASTPYSLEALSGKPTSLLIHPHGYLEDGNQRATKWRAEELIPDPNGRRHPRHYAEELVKEGDFDTFRGVMRQWSVKDLRGHRNRWNNIIVHTAQVALGVDGYSHSSQAELGGVAVEAVRVIDQVIAERTQAGDIKEEGQGEA